MEFTGQKNAQFDKKLSGIIQKIEDTESVIDEVQDQMKDAHTQIRNCNLLLEKNDKHWSKEEMRIHKSRSSLEKEKLSLIEEKNDLSTEKDYLQTEIKYLQKELGYTREERSLILNLSQKRVGSLTNDTPQPTKYIRDRDVIEQNTQHAITKSFTGSLRRENEMVESMADSLDFYLDEWQENPNREGSSHPYYACYTSIVNGSMTGKSRTAAILAQHGVLVFYLNIKSNRSGGYPLRTNSVATVSDIDCNPDSYRSGEKIYADIYMCSFFVACLDILLKWLRNSKDKKASRKLLADSWFNFQMGSEFGDEVI